MIDIETVPLGIFSFLKNINERHFLKKIIWNTNEHWLAKSSAIRLRLLTSLLEDATIFQLDLEKEQCWLAGSDEEIDKLYF